MSGGNYHTEMLATLRTGAANAREVAEKLDCDPGDARKRLEKLVIYGWVERLETFGRKKNTAVRYALTVKGLYRYLAGPY